MYHSHFILSMPFLSQGIVMDYYSNMRAILGNTGNSYNIVFPYLKDKKQYLPFNKLYFRILEFYSYGHDSPEIVLSPKEVIFICLWSIYSTENYNLIILLKIIAINIY